MINVQNLRKSYGDTVAVDNLSMTIADNHIYWLSLAPTAPAKRRTLNIITGVWLPDAGEVVIDG